MAQCGDKPHWPFRVSVDEMAFDSCVLRREIDAVEEYMSNSTDDDSCFGVSQFNSMYSALKFPYYNPLWANSSIHVKDSNPLYKLSFEDDYDSTLGIVMMNPRTGSLVQDQFGQCIPAESIQPKEEPKPYHWTHDHDYTGKLADELYSVRESKKMDIKEESESESEPVVEVWEIDSFAKEPQRGDAGYRLNMQDAAGEYQEFSSVRKSTRTAQLKRKIQARKLTDALRAGLTKEKAKKTRQYKNIKPKNSVETTPSQSDFEEWTSQPVRPTYTRITKKKTSKGRIDHSESERHRREVLREKFAALSKVVPARFLRGEKPSSQISKQKILNGAKAFIAALAESKSTYKTCFHKNEDLRRTLLSLKPTKYIKKK